MLQQILPHLAPTGPNTVEHKSTLVDRLLVLARLAQLRDAQRQLDRVYRRERRKLLRKYEDLMRHATA